VRRLDGLKILDSSRRILVFRGKQKYRRIGDKFTEMILATDLLFLIWTEHNFRYFLQRSKIFSGSKNLKMEKRRI